MTKKVVFAVALALVVVGIAAPSASAACNPPKFASTYNSGTGAFVNFHTTLTPPLTASAQMWSGSTDFSGTCGGTFVYFTDPTDVGFTISLGDACVPGCPAGNLIVKVVVTDGGSSQQFVANGVPETPLGANNWDYSGTTNITMVNAHRPRVSASSRAQGTVSIFGDHAAGYGGAVDGLTCVLRAATANSAPSSAVANWPTVLNTSPADASGNCPALTGVPIDCTTITDRWLAYQYTTTAGADPVVGDPVRISCNPALAEPPAKGKINPKKPLVDHRQ